MGVLVSADKISMRSPSDGFATENLVSVTPLVLFNERFLEGE
jgi:hypothetical protein